MSESDEDYEPYELDEDDLAGIATRKAEARANFEEQLRRTQEITDRNLALESSGIDVDESSVFESFLEGGHIVKIDVADIVPGDVKISGSATGRSIATELMTDTQVNELLNLERRELNSSLQVFRMNESAFELICDFRDRLLVALNSISISHEEVNIAYRIQQATKTSDDATFVTFLGKDFHRESRDFIAFWVFDTDCTECGTVILKKINERPSAIKIPDNEAFLLDDSVFMHKVPNMESIKYPPNGHAYRKIIVAEITYKNKERKEHELDIRRKYKSTLGGKHKLIKTKRHKTKNKKTKKRSSRRSKRSKRHKFSQKNKRSRRNKRS
jgi:hypothetical protein